MGVGWGCSVVLCCGGQYICADQSGSICQAKVSIPVCYLSPYSIQEAPLINRSLSGTQMGHIFILSAKRLHFALVIRLPQGRNSKSSSEFIYGKTWYLYGPCVSMFRVWYSDGVIFFIISWWYIPFLHNFLGLYTSRHIIYSQGLHSLSGRTFYLSDLSVIWQAPRQQYCRGACQISERYGHYNTQSRGFETSRDLVVIRLVNRGPVDIITALGFVM